MRPRFVEGELYWYDAIAPFVWRGGGGHRGVPPGALFRYGRDPVSNLGFFDEVVEERNPLVDSMAAQKAVEELRSRGMTYREISRLAGVSVEAVHRAAGGVGNVRRSTEEALLAVAAVGNGKVY
jgi:hypothetical protein